jgi:peptidyl-tRNA hydrolase, PTH1 family
VKLVVGLGNPGSRYAKTRHNVGFLVVEELARAASFPEWREKFSGEFTKGRIDGEDVVLLKPQTFMNDSGRSVQAAVAFFHVAAQGGAELVVVHDELDLPFADVRLKVGGGHSGHNGLRSIIGVLGADFARVRVGIGRPPPEFRGEVADFVLQDFDPVEAASVGDVVKKSVQAVRRWVEKGPLAANETNARGRKKD